MPSLLGKVWYAGFHYKAKIAQILANREDSEHEAQRSRVVAALIWTLVHFGLMQAGYPDAERTFDFMFAPGMSYLGLAVILFLHLLYFPNPNSVRRVLSITSDAGILLCTALAFGADHGFLLPLYLWMVFSSGFRYGTAYLTYGAILSVTSLSVLWGLQGGWTQAPITCIAKIAGMLLLIGYVSRFLKAFNYALEGEKQASRAKSRFLASISHEVRTPLNAICGLSDLLIESRIDGEQRRMAKTISESGQSLLHLINTLLDFSRAESGRMPEKLESFSLFALVGRVYRVSKVQSTKKGLNLTIHGDPALGSSYFGNMRFLEDCLINLLTNAIKFTEKGSVTLSISVVESEKNSQRLRFEVIDTGPGIPKDAQQAIFESFSQQDESILDRFGGSGLGLALCREYVHSMGGEISLRSEVGKGSNFSIEVPLQYRQIEREMMEPDCHFPMVLVTHDEDLVLSLGSNYMVDQAHASVEQGLQAVTEEAVRKGATPVLLLDRALIKEVPQEIEKRLAKSTNAGSLEFVWIGDEGEIAQAPALGYASSALSWIDRRQPRYDLRKLASFANHLHDSLDGITATSHENSPQSRTILVADDNKTNQMVIEKMLISMGHDVILVGDGQQALEQLQEGCFDLVLMDINMPVLNGLDASEQYTGICEEQGLVGTPILALTADANLEMEQACKVVGMQGCLHKPIDRTDLSKAIDLHAQVRTDNDNQGIDPVEPSQLQEQETKTNLEEVPVEQLSPVCETTVNDLVDLGGKDFVSELAEQFSHDAANALLKLSDAVDQTDSAAFRDEAHALRSASANIGAQMLFQTCLSWREIETSELESEGTQHLLRLQEEMQQAIEGLEQVLDVVLPKPGKLEFKKAG